ncbi:MAG TPA: hypothetical protein VJ256_04780 [Dehalococcoidia bacterium]|nr:hypothetical protein [Dehalococcoidia bacterium]
MRTLPEIVSLSGGILLVILAAAMPLGVGLPLLMVGVALTGASLVLAVAR